MKTCSLLLATLLLAALPSAAAPPPEAVQALPATSATASRICDGTSALTPIGTDTESGRVLFAVPPLAGNGQGWIVELAAVAADGATATAYPDPGGGRFGGSVGPGPVVAVRPCGAGCLQPLRFQSGAWEPLGEPLVVPAVITAAATYDLTGIPWLVVHGRGNEEGVVRAWAYRLEERDWKSKGNLMVTGVGDLQALPAAQRKDGILSGTGLFAASGSPEVWVQGLPDLPPDRRGAVMALAGSAVAYLSADGAIYLSANSGKSWRRSTWTPWSTSTGTTGMWRQGRDYWIDLPVSDHRGPLELAWFDRRTPEQESIFLTRLNPAGDWTVLTRSKSEIRTKNDDRLEVSHVFSPRAGSLVLLSGCVATAGGSGLVIRTYDKGALSEARFVPIHPVAPPR
ncbi:MAG TPA: hypothetical protein VGR07_12720 [Thermoanaerobaculia bacterium]|jgi:hypothetical protein|nr:hypothetical protein [Thermoanaerobaculia bacterium]